MAKRTLVVESNVPIVKPTKQNKRDLGRAVLEFNKAMRVAGLPVTLSTVEYELTDYRGRGNTVNDYQTQIEVQKPKKPKPNYSVELEIPSNLTWRPISALPSQHK